MSPESWNDGRLDDLNRRVESLIPLQTQVAALAAQFQALSRDMAELASSSTTLAHSIDRMREQTHHSTKEYARDRADRRAAMKVGLITAVVGGGITGIAAILAGVFH